MPYNLETGRLRVFGRRPEQHEIPVGKDLAVLEAHDGSRIAGHPFDRVRRAFDPPGPSDEKVQRKPVARVAQCEERLPLRVGRGAFVAPDVPRSCGERNAEAPSASLGTGELDVLRRDADVLSGRDARNPEREDVGRFAREERGLTSLGDGLLMFLFGLPALFQDGVDPNVAEGDGDFRDGRVTGIREAVDRLDDLPGLFRRKAEGVRDRNRRQRSDQGSRQFGPLERDEEGRTNGIAADDLHRRVAVAAGVVVMRRIERRPCGRGCEDAHEKRREYGASG